MTHTKCVHAWPWAAGRHRRGPQHRAFLGALLLHRGVLGLLGSRSLTDKGQGQTLGASIPPCSIPGAPGASVSGDFSPTLFLGPTGSAVWRLGVAVTLLPEQVSALLPSPNLASVTHQVLMTADPAFPWDTAGGLSTPVRGLVLLTEHLSVAALLLPVHASGLAWC